MSRVKKIFLKTLLTLGAVWLLGLLANFVFLEFFVDVYWYHSLGYLRLLLLKTGYKYLIFLGVTLLFFLVMFLNFWVASRYLGINMRNSGATPESRTGRLIRGFRNGSLKVYTPVSLLLAIPLALPLYRNWEQTLLFFFAPSTGHRDEMFNLDVSYYMFSLPVFNLLQGRLLLTLILLFVSLGVLYLAELKILKAEGRSLPLGAKLHLCAVVFLAFFVQTWGYILEAHMLNFSDANTPTFFGPGFTEARIIFPLIWISGFFVLVTAVFLVMSVLSHGRHHERRTWGFAVFALISGVLALISHGLRSWQAIPDLVTKLHIEPNYIEVQGKYMSSSIQATLHAYDLHDVEWRNYEELRADDSIPELGARADLENIPLWDYELLADVFQEVQAIRPYYQFSPPAAARYVVRDQLQQVFLAGREISIERLPAPAQTWVNRHLKYTHGFGAVMIPAAQRGEERMRWFLRDMPPVSDVGFSIAKPSIYYGVGEYHYVIAPNRSREFHFPGGQGEDLLLTDYTGIGGVPVSSFFKKALFSLYFKELQILVTRQTSSDSRIHFRRNLRERINILTPFLHLDREPYLVVTDDRLFWIQDAYTTSAWYPNSVHHEEHGFNYIRNSIKIVVDAYDGTVDYYLFEPNDPVARAYQRMYPGLIKSKDEMPPELLAQTRYPRDMFEIQMHIFQVYHQTNPVVFFKNEDRMEFAEIHHRDSLIRMEPYYLTLDLIDHKQPEFMLITPMLPVTRDNLRALAIAGCDGDNLGRIIMYSFPQGVQIFGPAQINALIDQNTEIAERITLWNQQGTEVRRGKMIVLPLGKHILYIQPLYLEASGRLRIPQLKRVIVVADETVVMDTTLERAVDRLQQLLEQEKLSN